MIKFSNLIQEQIVTYHATPNMNLTKPKSENGFGILWLAFNKKEAEHFGKNIWEITLKPNANIIDLRNIANPICKKFFLLYVEDKWSSLHGITEPISKEYILSREKTWNTDCTFSVLEKYEWIKDSWIKKFVKQNKVDGFIVNDNNDTGSREFQSIALFNMNVIEKSEKPQ